MAGKKLPPDAASLQAAVLLPCLQRPAVAARVHELLGLDDDETAAVLIAKLLNPALVLTDEREAKMRRVTPKTLARYKNDHKSLPEIL